MSFGFSPSDIVALVGIATKAYRGWKTACGEYSDITTALDTLLIILERVEDEVEEPHSSLLRNRRDANDIGDILSSCDRTIRELNTIISEFRGLGQTKSRERNWERLKFGNKNLSSLKDRLSQHQISISAYLNTIRLGSLSRIERELHTLPQQVQSTIDNLAAEIRAGRREGSIMTTYDDDEKDIWKQFRRELIGDGMRSSMIHKYKPHIKQYLRTLAEDGLLEEAEPHEEPSIQYGTMSSSCKNITSSELGGPVRSEGLSEPADKVNRKDSSSDESITEIETGVEHGTDLPHVEKTAAVALLQDSGNSSDTLDGSEVDPDVYSCTEGPLEPGDAAETAHDKRDTSFPATGGSIQDQPAGDKTGAHSSTAPIALDDSNATIQEASRLERPTASSSSGETTGQRDRSDRKGMLFAMFATPVKPTISQERVRDKTPEDGSRYLTLDTKAINDSRADQYSMNLETEAQIEEDRLRLYFPDFIKTRSKLQPVVIAAVQSAWKNDPHTLSVDLRTKKALVYWVGLLQIDEDDNSSLESVQKKLEHVRASFLNIRFFAPMTRFIKWQPQEIRTLVARKDKWPLSREIHRRMIQLDHSGPTSGPISSPPAPPRSISKPTTSQTAVPAPAQPVANLANSWGFWH